MAIDTISPLQSSVIDPGDSISFLVDDTYTTMTIQVQAASGLEAAYSGGAAQPGYTVSITNAAGRDTFVVTRSAGWDKSPQQVIVTEDESGSSTATTLSWFLSTTSVYPQGHQPFNAVSTGTLIVSEDDVVKRSDVGQIDFDDATFNVTDLGNGKVRVVDVGGVGSSCHFITATGTFSLAGTDGVWNSWNQTNGPNDPTWSADYGTNAGNPTLNRFHNGWLIPANGTLQSVKVMFTEPAGANDYQFELWKMPLSDGQTGNSLVTQLASITFTSSATANAVNLKSLTIDSSALLEDDLLVLFCTRTDSNGLVSTRCSVVLEWTET